ncbi:MAG: L-threonylcarbamoyladenylate synthase [Rikenellaceae bacterium]
MGRLIKLYSENTNQKSLSLVVDALMQGAILIFPTDSFYAMGCSLESVKAINLIKQKKGKNNDNLALICSSLQQASKYAKVDNATFKILKEHTPAPVTYILEATNTLPNKFLQGKKQVGIRITTNAIIQQIVELLGHPMVTTSIPKGKLEQDDMLNPELLWEEYASSVDFFIDGGDVPNTPSTVVELKSGELTIIREGGYTF